MLRALIAAVALWAGLACSGPAAADEPGATPESPGTEQIIRSMVRERDLTLLFEFARESLRSAIEGREAPPVPEELTERAEALARAVRTQGALAALALLAALEQRAKQALREAPAPRPALPPTRPYTPL
jgi:hypothetical protein